jgi:putative ABC transport system ATP-binding protein
LAKTLAGLCKPTAGVAEVAAFDPTQAMVEDSSRLIGYAGAKAVFHGTLRENVDLGRTGIGASRVREVLSQVGLSDAVLRLPDGVQTKLQTGGYPLSSSQVAQLDIARCIAFRPRLVIIDCLLDELADDVRDTVWRTLTAADAPWTLVVVTNHSAIADLCESQIAVRKAE